MNHVQAMAALNRKVLEVYSRRTTEKLRTVMPLRMALPRLENFLAMNVAKEVQKDTLVIRRGGEDAALGLQPSVAAAGQLFDATKEIDRAFLARTGSFPVGILIPYDEIAPLRTQRIDKLLTAAYRILEAGRKVRGSRSAIRSVYSREDFERLLQDLLRLYALETRALSRSLSLPRLLVPLREGLAKSLYEVMNDTANRLARELAGCVYRPDRLARC
ncbi:MAG: hypothetical protein D4S02_11240 [Rhodocyclaceae bacterium]|nr:MAG: hypothetical protein D4S02_11240 [Rhodocyclaceae bacterium]